MEQHDAVQLTEAATIGASLGASDGLRLKTVWTVEKYAAGIDAVRAGIVEPYEIVSATGNLLVNGGGDVLWAGVIGNVVTTTGVGYTRFSNGEASIGVGKSTTAAAVTQTDLQATSTGKFRKGMEATFPTHTTGTASTSAKNIAFKAIMSTAQANFAWQEFGVFNTTAQTGGRMLNRKVQNLGTKSTAATWAITATLSLA